MTEVLAAHPETAALLLDFDGCLAPVVVDPAAAAPPPETLAVLERLVEGLRLVAIVSGRPVDFLVNAVPLPGVELVGQYGLERCVDGRTMIEPAALRYRDAVAAAATEAEGLWPELLVERKGETAVTIHWRSVGEVSASVVSGIEALGAEHGLGVYPTRKARELRPPIAVDKGSAVRALLGDVLVTSAAYAGDDRGDLPVLDALDALEAEGRLARSVRIAVRSTEVPGELIERADLIVDGPEGLFKWLKALDDALR